VSIAIDEQCCELVRIILNAPGVQVEHCDRLLALLTEHETKAIDSFVEGNRADYICMRQTVHDLQHRTGSFDPMSMRDEWGLSGDMTSPLECFQFFVRLGGESSPEQSAKMAAYLEGRLLPGAWSGGKMLSDKDYAKEVDALNHFFSSILALAERRDSRLQKIMEVEATEDPILETTLLARLLIPAEIAFWHAVSRSETRLRGTQCLAALRRWQLQHGDAPPNLETIVKAAGLPRVPMDRFFDQPLRMGLVAGIPVIYSVGPDGQDNKAQVEWNLVPNEPGDFIFRLEKPPQ
jgi:hypothetical protein